MSKYNSNENYDDELLSDEHKKTNCRNRSLSCTLCDQNVASSEMNAHLMQCGNKTIKCPNCSKYIRRAIYVYHVDNKCIDWDEENTFDRNNIQIDNDVFVPCEICYEQIRFSSYNYHTENCGRNQTDRRQDFAPPNSVIDHSSYEQDVIKSNDDKPARTKVIARQVQKKTTDVRDCLSSDYYPLEVDYATDKLQCNILIMGSPRVGKSQLINALCNGENLAKTSSSLDSCTKEAACYVLEDNQQQTPGVNPFRINFWDTPGIESWTNENGREIMLNFIAEKDPVCLIYCASPGGFADLKQLHLVLEFCQKKQIFCALVCTNMWANSNRKIVLEEFEKQLAFFGDRVEKLFDQGDNRSPHKVIHFGSGALCTMVNSKEYYDPDLSNIRKPIQGIDELIHSIMEELDDEKLLGWCYAVLYRRSYWEKVKQKVSGFYLQYLSNTSYITVNQMILDYASRLFISFRKQKK